MTGWLAVAGLGPGADDLVTPEVQAALVEATDIVGYIPHVARVAPRPGLRLHPSDNRVELDRARAALDMAAAGWPWRSSSIWCGRCWDHRDGLVHPAGATRGGCSESAPSLGPYVAVLALVVVVSLATSLVLTFIMPPAAYLSLPTRAWQLAIGGLVALTATSAAPANGGHGDRMDRTRNPRVRLCLGERLLRLSGRVGAPPTLGTALVIGAGCANAERGCGRLLAGWRRCGRSAGFRIRGTCGTGRCWC